MTSAGRITGPPIDLANMRANGVRSVYAHCGACEHEAVVNVDALPAETFVPDVAKRLRCTACGSKKVTVVPYWIERAWPVGPRV